MSERKAKQLRKLERKIDQIEQWIDQHSIPWWKRIVKGAVYGKRNEGR